MKPSRILAWMNIQYQKCSVIVCHVLAKLVNVTLVRVFLMREPTSVGWFEGPFYLSKKDRVSFNVSRNKDPVLAQIF